MTEESRQPVDPYPGLASFQDRYEDREFFFGREVEKRILFQTALSETLTVLYGRSGVGKTSLINAGLVESLRKRDFFPIVLRLSDNSEDQVRSIIRQIEDQAKSSNVRTERDGSDDSEDGIDLWEYLSTTKFYDEGERLRPFLIFDQFEELFAMASEDALSSRFSLVGQLSDLVRGRLSRERSVEMTALVDGFEEDDPRQIDAISRLYGYSGPDLRILLSLREDYLPELDGLRQAIPNILRNSLRLLPLSVAQARDAIAKPAANSKMLGDDTFTFEPNALEELIRFLRRERKGGKVVEGNAVEPVHLQIICRQLNERRRRRRSRQISRMDLGGRRGMERIISDYYRMVLRRFPAIRPGWNAQRYRLSLANYLVLNCPRIAIRKLCERGLISQGMRRNSLILDDCMARYGVSKVDLQRLENERLLRVERRLGSRFYELIHDTLVEPLRTYRRRRRVMQLSGLGAVLAIALAIPVSQEVILSIKNFRTLSTVKNIDNGVEDRNAAFRSLISRNAQDLSVLHLEGLNLSDMELRNMQLVDVNLSSAELRNGKLDGTVIIGGNLAESNLSETSMTDIRIIGTDLSGANLEGSKLVGARILGGTLRGADFRRADLQRAMLENVDLENADLRAANLRRTKFSFVSFDTINLGETEWWLASGWGSGEMIRALEEMWPHADFANSTMYKNKIKKLNNNIDSARNDLSRARLLNELAWYRAIRGVELEKALENVNESLDKLKIGRNSHTKGYILLQLGRVGEALVFLRDADWRFDSRMNRYHLGLGYERNGEVEKAHWNFSNAEERGYVPTFELLLTPPLDSNNYGWHPR